jgi:hypothetical protein
VAFHQLEQDVEPLLRGQVGIELIVGPVCIFKTAEFLNDPVHD